jgi:glycosyltransferase involved in cell wall biosynthesis
VDVNPTNRPIHVLQVIARMNVGGPASIVSDVVRDLDTDEFRTTLACGTVEPGEADFLELRDPTLPVTRLTSLGRSVKVWGDVRAFVDLVRVMRRERPDIVHTHTAKAGVLGRLAAMVARVPVRVHTFHGHVLHGYFSPRVTNAVRLVERLLARRTTAIVAVGTQVRDELLAAGIGRADQYTVIPPGVAAARPIDRAEARQALGLPVNVPVALFVGRLTRIKRVDRLIDAWRQVHQHVPDAVLAIAGEGNLLHDARRQAADLGASVQFLGWQSDLAPLYVAADVAVLSSDNEGMPVTLIEASMAGVPCVTTDVGSASEVVLNGVTGFVVPPDAAALAEALAWVIDDTELRTRFGEEAHRYAEAAFGTARLVADHAALYRRVAG